MAIKNVSFTAPTTDFDIERKKVERARQMATLLGQQATTPLEGQMVSGHYIAPSPLAAVGKIAQAFASKKQMDDLDAKEADIGKRQNQQLIEGLQNYQNLLQGTPDQTVESKAMVSEDGTPQTKTIPGTPGSRQAALASLLQSGNPMLQQYGLQQAFAKPESQFNKIDPKDYTPQSIAKFAQTQNYGDLMPARKMELAPSGQVWNPYDVTPGSVLADPNKPFSVGADGKPVANTQFQNYEINKAVAGKPVTSVSVNTATKPFLQEIGKGAGDAVNNAYAGAQSAASTLQNVNQIRQGLGNAMLGPGANVRVTLAQIGQTLGIGGKDTAEQLQNTRQVIQGLARQELSAASQMKGQGQITESERGILRRAEAGDISEFTKPELETLLNAVEKTARYRINAHQQNMERLRQDPNAQGIVDYMQVNVPPPSNQPASNGFSIRRLP